MFCFLGVLYWGGERKGRKGRRGGEGVGEEGECVWCAVYECTPPSSACSNETL
jgi:hypothetical protein